MIIIHNNIIPFKGFKVINICGILFHRKDASPIDDITITHETIHTKQIQEMFYIFFYLWYILEWIVRLFMKGNAYKNISFERESYENQYNKNYLNNRNFKYKWVKYL